MTIVERLRSPGWKEPSWGDACDLMDEAADEIERLEQQNNHLAEQCDTLMAENKKLYPEKWGAGTADEIERLRIKLKEVEEAWYGRCVVIDERDAEIERLQAHIMELVRDNKHLRAEIEALQRMRHEEAVT